MVALDSIFTRKGNDMFINGNKTDAISFAYDGCHKIYLCESGMDVAEAMKMGYDILPIEMLEEIYNESCSLKFISNWQLSKQFVPQFEDAIFGEPA